jgi:hypothetical protein
METWVSDVAPQPRPVATATWLTRNGRRRQPKIHADWPWAADIVIAWHRISAVPHAADQHQAIPVPRKEYPGPVEPQPPGPLPPPG